MKRELNPDVTFSDGVPCGRLRDGTTADDYRYGLSDDVNHSAVRQEISAEWENKPHRLIYDLAGEVLHLQRELEEAQALPKCPYCGTVGEVLVKWEDDVVHYLKPNPKDTADIGSVIVRVPVWRCNLVGTCGRSWTDDFAGQLRDKAVAEARGKAIFDTR